MRKGEKAKKTAIQRIRKNIHTMIDPETYEYLKNGGLNAGRILDTAISELRTKTKTELTITCQNNEKQEASGVI